ncbi:hypothetical protein DBR12_09015 [Acidovorax sp. HMWF029]|nr:hypothetical protein DBR12_09015 [Acidovorax sp. HMWF029]
MGCSCSPHVRLIQWSEAVHGALVNCSSCRQPLRQL